MPNLAEAASIMEMSAPVTASEETAPDTSTPLAETPRSGSDQSQASAGEASPEARLETPQVDANGGEAPISKEPVADPKPTPAQLRAQAMKAHIAKLQRESQERAESKRIAEMQRALKAQADEIAAEKAAAARQRQLWQESLKDPVKAYRELGMRPEEAYDAITKATLAEDTPEGREARLVEKIRQQVASEYADKLKKLEDLEAKFSQVDEHLKTRAEREAFVTKRAAETEFLKIVGQSGYEVLADYYEEPDLLMLGDAIADELHASGKTFNIQDVADELKNRIESQLKRAEQRRSQRKPAANLSSATAQAAPATSPATASKAITESKTISNNMASATGSTGKRAMTRAERLAAAERELSAMELVKSTAR